MAGPSPDPDEAAADADANAAFAERKKILEQQKAPASDDAEADADAEAAFAGRGGKTAAPSNKSWSDIAQDAPNQFFQGLTEGGAGLLGGIPDLANWADNKLGIKAPLDKTIQDYVGSNALLGYAKHMGYDPTPPDTMTGKIIRGAGQATASLPVGMGMGMGPAANAFYTYAPEAAGAVADHFGYNPLLASLPFALSASFLERKLITEPALRKTAQEAAQKAADDAAAATAAKNDWDAGKPAATRLVQSQKEGANFVSEGFKTNSEADVAKWHDAEHTGADNQLAAAHTGADADREAAAANLGTSQTLVEGAGKMQDKARQWLTGPYKEGQKKAEMGMYYKPDGSPLIAQDAMGDVGNLKSSIEHSYMSGGEAEPVVSLFRSKLPEAVNAKLDMIAKQQGKPVGEAPQFTFDDMRKIRSAIGDALGDPSVLSSIGVKKLNEMYRGISEDMRANVSHNAGQEGLDQFDAFNKESQRLFGVAGTVGEHVVTTTNAAKESITPFQLSNTDKLWNDEAKIKQLRSEPLLNEGVNEVAASKLRAGGRDIETAYNDKPEAKTALFGQQGQTLDNITASRTAAEKAAADTKAAADAGKKQKMKDISGQAKAIKRKEGSFQADQAQTRAETETALTQEEKARKAALDEANAKLNDLTGPRKSKINIPDWVKTASTLGGLGGAFQAGKNLGPLVAQFPSYGQDVLGGIATGGATAAALGGRELWINPRARKNLLQAGAATGTKPSEPKKESSD